MVRTPSYDQNGLKKGAWSPEEDQLLRSYITTNGPSKWRDLPNLAGLKRCGKSCRLRWMNYLRPNIKHGNYTKQEEDLIMQLHQKYGNKWAIIASKLSGRTDNEIKNYWHTHLKKRVQPPRPITTPRSKSDPKQVDTNVSDQPEKRQIKSNVCHDINILESCPLLFPEEMISTTTSTPISREVSTSTPSSLGISTVGFDDDLGLEEFINWSELFAEKSSLISPLPLNHEMENNDRRYATASTFGGEYSGTSRTMDVYGELQVEDGDICRNWYSDNNDVLLSSGVNYYDDDVLEFFCNQEGI